MTDPTNPTGLSQSLSALLTLGAGISLAISCNRADDASAASNGEQGAMSATTGHGDSGFSSAPTEASGANETSSPTASQTSEDPSFNFDLGVPAFDFGDEPHELVPIPETCAQAEAGDSTIGCEFYAVDLDQYDDSEFLPYAVVVANPQLETVAHVVVEAKTADGWEEVTSADVEPMGLAELPQPDFHHEGSGVQVGGARRVRSDVPVAAYQFNPLSNASMTSDASMLYPATTWDTQFRVLGWGGGPDRAYVTIVASRDNTVVQVTPGAIIESGAGVPAAVAGEMVELFALDEGDIAEVMVRDVGTSLAGTKIISADSKPFAVFTGHECAWVPHGVTACDHLEEQISGVRRWGKSFVAPRMPVREISGVPESSLWQVVASEANTTVTVSAHPDVTGLPFAPATLQAGGVLEFYARGTFENPGDLLIEADKPVGVANLMTGAGVLVSDPNARSGDPAILQISPIEQFLPRYVVLVPTSWDHDVITIVAPVGAEVLLDGAVLDAAMFSPVGDAYGVARVDATDGVHRVESDVGVMVTVVGYGPNDSYAYLGGAGTGVINPTPAG